MILPGVYQPKLEMTQNIYIDERTRDLPKMDDDLGPAASAPPSRPNDDAEGGDDSGDEDLVDWTKLPSVPFLYNVWQPYCSNAQVCRGAHPSAKPVIPKRGDKDFEPAAGGSSLQAYSLERSRQAMTDALRGTRNISS